MNDAHEEWMGNIKNGISTMKKNMHVSMASSFDETRADHFGRNISLEILHIELRPEPYLVIPYFPSWKFKPPAYEEPFQS